MTQASFLKKKDQLSRITSFLLGSIKSVFTFEKPLVSSACLHRSLSIPLLPYCIFLCNVFVAKVSPQSFFASFLGHQAQLVK